MNQDERRLKVLEHKLKIDLSKRSNFSGTKALHPKHKNKRPKFFGDDSNSPRELISLDLSNLALQEIPEVIFSFPNLLSLDLSQNNIVFVPTKIARLRKLNTLNLQGNKIEELPRELFHIESFKKINVTGNPLFSPPPELIARGIDSVVAYYDSLKAGQIVLNECKVIILGDGGAGKTSLLKRLKNENFDANESQTHGIRIEEHFFEIENVNVKVNYWDFGGQEVMHSTHQFFFTKRSLYLLVVDSRKEDKIEYWLKLIKTLAQNAPVIIVINKIDENPSFDLNRRFLKEKYPNILDFYKISCANSSGLDKLLSGISNSLKQIELLDTLWPTNWLSVKMYLESIQDDFISLNEFRRLCSHFGIDLATSQNTLVNYLNDLGVVIHFEDLALSNTHVLEPHWLTTAVYRIINSRKIAEQNGVLFINQIGEIINRPTREVENDSLDFPISKTIDTNHEYKIKYYIALILDLIKTRPEYQKMLIEKLSDFFNQNKEIPERYTSENVSKEGGSMKYMREDLFPDNLLLHFSNYRSLEEMFVSKYFDELKEFPKLLDSPDFIRDYVNLNL